MEFLLVKFVPCKTYLSLVDPNGKSRFACFSEKQANLDLPFGSTKLRYVLHGINFTRRNSI